MGNNNSHNGGFFSGFLWGAIIGGGVVFLLGTKKGKKLLKTITEEGLSGIAELEDFIEDEAEENNEPVSQKPKPETNGHVAPSVSETPPPSDLTGRAKRLFRGIPKKT